MTDSYFGFGDRILKYRKAAGMTQAELAEKIGINRATISKYESNEINPTWGQLVKISQVLNVSFANLLLGDRVEGRSYISIDEVVGSLDHLPPEEIEAIEKEEKEKAETAEFYRKAFAGRLKFLFGTNFGKNDLETYWSLFVSLHDSMKESGGLTPGEEARFAYFPKESDQAVLNSSFSKLNRTGQKEAVKRVEELTQISKYQKSPSEAQEAAFPSKDKTTPENNKNPSEGQ